MKRLMALLAVLMVACQFAAAQTAAAKTDKDEIQEMRREIVREMKLGRGNSGSSAPTALSTTDVGEPDSFGKNVLFLGVAGSGAIYVYTSCDPAVLLADLGLTLGTDDRCLAAPNPAVTATDTFTDVARITIPAKSVKNIVYMLNNHTTNWDFSNSGAGPLSAQMSYSPSITIESDAFNDPAAVDPVTGLPLNGTYTTGGNGSKFLNMLLQPGDFSNYVDSYSRDNTLGFSRTYFSANGFPAGVINNLYNKPMTIRLGARVSVRGVSFGQFVYSARFLGN